jgi:hypothetical protein
VSLLKQAQIVADTMKCFTGQTFNVSINHNNGITYFYFTDDMYMIASNIFIEDANYLYIASRLSDEFVKEYNNDTR